jgi:hypothetical protein
MYVPSLCSDDVSPLEANLDRMYWSTLLNGRMMPGLGLAASRMRIPGESGRRFTIKVENTPTELPARAPRQSRHAA